MLSNLSAMVNCTFATCMINGTIVQIKHPQNARAMLPSSSAAGPQHHREAALSMCERPQYAAMRRIHRYSLSAPFLTPQTVECVPCSRTQCGAQTPCFLTCVSLACSCDYHHHHNRSQFILRSHVYVPRFCKTLEYGKTTARITRTNLCEPLVHTSFSIYTYLRLFFRFLCVLFLCLFARHCRPRAHRNNNSASTRASVAFWCPDAITAPAGQTESGRKTRAHLNPRLKLLRSWFYTAVVWFTIYIYTYTCTYISKHRQCVKNNKPTGSMLTISRDRYDAPHWGRRSTLHTNAPSIWLVFNRISHQITVNTNTKNKLKTDYIVGRTASAFIFMCITQT